MNVAAAARLCWKMRAGDTYMCASGSKIFIWCLFSISLNPLLHLFQLMLEPVFVLFPFLPHLMKNGFAIRICQESVQPSPRLSESTNVWLDCGPH